jgi:hypothetical protein
VVACGVARQRRIPAPCRASPARSSPAARQRGRGPREVRDGDAEHAAPWSVGGVHLASAGVRHEGEGGTVQKSNIAIPSVPVQYRVYCSRTSYWKPKSHFCVTTRHSCWPCWLTGGRHHGFGDKISSESRVLYVVCTSGPSAPRSTTHGLGRE